jgi:hypothetical protein
MGRGRQHDSVDDALRVAFFEVEPMVHGEVHRKDEFIREDFEVEFDDDKPIDGKWLYLFYSEGSEYAIRRSDKKLQNGEFVRRALHPEETGGQTIANPHISKFQSGDDTPGNPSEVLVDAADLRTWDPIERAEHAKFELFFENGRFRSQDIERRKLWEKSIFERPRPKGELQSTFALPLVLRGKPVRWYFLLSTIRLGPAALRACTQRGAADGLSIKHTAQANRDTDFDSMLRRDWEEQQDVARFVTPEDLRVWAELKAAGHAFPEKILRGVCRIGVVDPYHYAARLNDHAYSLALDKFLLFLNDLPGNRNLWHPDILLDPAVELGDLNDLYAMAELLVPILDGQGVEWREGTARKVLRFVRTQIRHAENRCEAEALRLVSWLMGPAHRLIDIGATMDTRDVPRKAKARREAAEARAYALAHWYNVTSRLGLTTAGARFLGDMLSESLGDANDDRRRLPRADHGDDPGPTPKSYNPIQRILLPYAGKKLDEGSVDAAALEIAAEVVPDLIVLGTLFDQNDGSDASADRNAALRAKKQAVVALFNNLRVLPFALDASPATAPASEFAGPKTWFDRGLWVTTTGKRIAGSIFDAEHSRPVARAMREVFRHEKSKNPAPVGARVKKMLKESPVKSDDAAGRAATASKALVAWMNVLWGQASEIEKINDPARPAGDRFRSAATRATSVASAFQSTAGAIGIETAALGDLVQMSDDFDSAWARIGGSLKVSMSVTAMVTGVWSIYSDAEAASKAFSQGATGVGITKGIGVFTGVVTTVVGMLGWGGALALTSPVGLLVTVLGIATLVLAAVVKDGFLVGTSFGSPTAGNFLRHCWFSSDEELRNKWIGGNADDDTFAGRRHMLPDDRWPVAHQRVALMNHLARFSASSEVSVTRGEEGFEFEDVRIDLAWSLLPRNARFRISLGFEDQLEDGRAHAVVELEPSPFGIAVTDVGRHRFAHARFRRIDRPSDGFPFRATVDVRGMNIFGGEESVIVADDDDGSLPWVAKIRFEHEGGHWETHHEMVDDEERARTRTTLPKESEFRATQAMPRKGAGWKI